MRPSTAKRAPSHVTSTTNVPGTRTCAASSSDWLRATCTPAAAHLLGRRPVAPHELGLAPDAAQDAQPGDRVGAERRQVAEGGALLGLPAVQGLQGRTEGERERRDAQQHDRAEDGGSAQQQHRDEGERDDGSGAARGDVEGARDRDGVGRADADDLAGARARVQRGAEPDGLRADPLRAAERGHHPVGDGEAVPAHPGDGLHGGQHHEGQHPVHERVVVATGDAVVDRAAQDVGRQRLRGHPDDAEHHPAEDGGQLQAREAQQEAGRRAQVRAAGVGEGEGLHVGPRYGGRRALRFDA